MLKFLHNTFGLTADDSRADDNYALRLAAEYGHVDVLKWLHETFGLTDVDARADDNYALRYAAENVHLDVLVLHDSFKLTAIDTNT